MRRTLDEELFEEEENEFFKRELYGQQQGGDLLSDAVLMVLGIAAMFALMR